MQPLSLRHSGARQSREPGIHNHHREYGFRACAQTGASRNDDGEYSARRALSRFVMAGLDPAIHDLVSRRKKDVDGRNKSGHDDGKSRARITGAGMEFETLVQTRKSVRGFKKKPVP